MEIVKVDSIAAFSQDTYKRVLINNAKGLLRLLCFEPNQEVPLHRHPKGDEYFFVVHGKGKIKIAREESEVEPGSIIRAPANTPHQWKNGSERLVLFSILVPPSSYELAEETVKMEHG
jgi:quercetin dioxygenase-like cupin family protein